MMKYKKTKQSKTKQIRIQKPLPTILIKTVFSPTKMPFLTWKQIVGQGPATNQDVNSVPIIKLTTQ